MQEPFEPVVSETYLSRKPDPNGFYASMISCLVMVSITWLHSTNVFELRDWLAARADAILEKHQYWRLITSIFVHSGPQHLLSNLLPYAALSYVLYGYFGWPVYPIAALLCTAISDLFILRTYPPDISLVGASGVVYWMAAFWLTLYLAIEQRFGFGKRIFRTIGITLIFLLPTSLDPSVSYRSHAVGFITGILYGLIYYFYRRNFFKSFECMEYE